MLGLLALNLFSSQLPAPVAEFNTKIKEIISFPGLIPTFSGKSMSVKDLALANWQFIEGPALNEKRIGLKGWWLNAFRCKNGGCRSFSSSVLPPPLFWSDLKLVANASGDKAKQKQLAAMNFLLAGLCKRNLSVCERYFITLTKAIPSASSLSAKTGKLLSLDYKRKPDSLPRWFSKSDRFAVLASLTRRTEDIEKAKHVFSDEYSDVFEKYKGAFLYRDGATEVWAGSCYKPLAALKLYSATNDKIYLDQAIQFAGSAKLEEHAKDFNTPEAMRGRLVHSGLICADLLVSLWETTKDQKYLNGAKKLIQYFVENNFDLKDRKLVTGTGAFVRIYSKDTARKYTLDTLWSANLLLRLPEGTGFKIASGSIIPIAHADDDEGSSQEGAADGPGASSADVAGPDVDVAPETAPEVAPDVPSSYYTDPKTEIDIAVGLIDEIADILGITPSLSVYEITLEMAAKEFSQNYDLTVQEIQQNAISEILGPNVDINSLNQQQAMDFIQAVAAMSGYNSVVDVLEDMKTGIQEMYDKGLMTDLDYQTQVNTLNAAIGLFSGNSNDINQSSESDWYINGGRPCDDGIDNDYDRLMDLNDPDCFGD